MIFRAAFWIAVVAVFMPHEPDLGYGRPGLTGLAPPKPADWASVKLPAKLCADNPQVCAGAMTVGFDLKGTILNNIDRVKGELKAREQARSEDGRNTKDDLAALISSH